MSPFSRPVLAAAVLFLTPAVADALQRCRKGIPCGNTCISATKTCRVGAGTATRADDYPAAPAPPPSRRVEPQPVRAAAPSARFPALDERARIATLFMYPQVPHDSAAPLIGWSAIRVFMAPSCPGLRAIPLDERIAFYKAEHAQAAGYVKSPAPDC